MFASTNPATGETLRRFEGHDSDVIERKLAKAISAHKQFRHTTLEERSGLMSAAAALLEGEKERFANIITLEMGKVRRAALEEVQKCANGCRYYAENAAKFLADQEISTGQAHSYVRHDSLGTILAIMPWNFPFWQVFRFAAPALMAGNVALLKHAANVPQCALAIEEIFRRAGFKEGVFQTLLIDTKQTQNLISDPRIMAVTLTGSERAGSEVASAAGRQIKKSVLELGGSDPFIVMPSANLEAAITTGVMARTINTGQSCIAAKRFIVADQVYEPFVSGFVDRMRALIVGDPLDSATEIGPLATEAILQNLDRQVQESIAAGATMLVGGKRIKRPGCYYEPTVLTNVPRTAPAFNEEMFGPVASMFRVSDASEAIQTANDSSFGLGASAWTNDPSEQRRFASELEAGMVFINSMVASDPRLPFGGIKRSGFGRELGPAGINEFINLKTISIM